MRQTRDAQTHLFNFYADHPMGQQLRKLSELLDRHPIILSLLEGDFDKRNVRERGARGLSLESIFRCLLLKQILNVSYYKLAFHLADSQTYRTFARLRPSCFPGKSALQATIRRISPETLEQINRQLILHGADKKQLSLDSMRIDSTLVESNILDPRDSQLLADGVRVLSRMMAQSARVNDVKLRFVDQRKRSKSLAFQIFHAKKPAKSALYSQLLDCVVITLKQVARAIETVKESAGLSLASAEWLKELGHYRDLTLRVVDQTQRRVFLGESVPASEKIVSLFEPHTDIIVKGQRKVQYGHKVNLATQAEGFVTYLKVESGNPADSSLFMPVLEASQKDYGTRPREVVADGGYASEANVIDGRESGVDRVVFNKRCGLGFHAMGVKKKTFERLRNFRAGVEGNISELMRAYGMAKATWKHRDGFIAYVWSCALSYNVMRMVRLGYG